MIDYLDSIISRSLDPAGSIQPRWISIFDPKPALASPPPEPSSFQEPTPNEPPSNNESNQSLGEIRSTNARLSDLFHRKDLGFIKEASPISFSASTRNESSFFSKSSQDSSLSPRTPHGKTAGILRGRERSADSPPLMRSRMEPLISESGAEPGNENAGHPLTMPASLNPPCSQEKDDDTKGAPAVLLRRDVNLQIIPSVPNRAAGQAESKLVPVASKMAPAAQNHFQESHLDLAGQAAAAPAEIQPLALQTSRIEAASSVQKLRSTGSNPSPVIRVTIGHIDVKAVMPSPPSRAHEKPAIPRPRLSLDDYLKTRNGGNR
jgi:hypothetical protein